MDLSTDSQDFYVSINDHNSDDDQNMETVMEHEEASTRNVHEDGPNGGLTLPPPLAVIHLTAGSLSTDSTGSPATAKRLTQLHWKVHSGLPVDVN